MLRMLLAGVELWDEKYFLADVDMNDCFCQSPYGKIYIAREWTFHMESLFLTQRQLYIKKTISCWISWLVLWTWMRQNHNVFGRVKSVTIENKLYNALLGTRIIHDGDSCFHILECYLSVFLHVYFYIHMYMFLISHLPVHISEIGNWSHTWISMYKFLW